MMKAIMYVNGDLTKGTRVYRQHQGQRFDVSFHKFGSRALSLVRIGIFPVFYTGLIPQ